MPDAPTPAGDAPLRTSLLPRARGTPPAARGSAHCVTGNSALNLRVTVGRTVLDANQGKIRNVSRINIHPSYRPLGDSSFDAAVLTLRRPVTGVKPVKLATASQDNLERTGRLATVAGWGNTIAQPPGGITGNSFPQRMREVQIPIVSDAKAGKAYGSSYVPSLMISAGQAGKDSCQGDSGGPLFATVSPGVYTQIGITSFGAGCAAPGFPGVYTEVNNPSVRNFITTQAGR